MVVLNLNARFQPMHRHELEDALDEIMDRLGIGEVCGGGTALMPTKEVSSCDIEIDCDDDKNTLEKLVDIIDALGVPKGSRLILPDSPEIPVGRLEGLALYLNGTDLPAEVYQSNDINDLIEQADTLLEGIGRIYSWWEGPAETALYFYGESYEKILNALKKLIEESPLCQKSRVVQIA